MALTNYKLDTVFAKTGIRVLEAMDEMDKPITIRGLAEHRDRQYSNTSHYISKMERDGYIGKKPLDGSDREKEIYITDKGQQVLDAFRGE